MKLNTLALAVSVLITGCGGGGGGGPGSNPIIRPDLPNVPYYTPVKVGNATMSTVSTATSSVAGAFSKDLTGSGQENLIVAGRNLDTARSPSQITVYGWNNGVLVDQTSQWFSGSDNVIAGTEPDIEFGDFNNDGKTDLYIAPSTDSSSSRGAPGVVLINNGSSFTRTNLNIGSTWAHDSVVYDFDRDGRSDIFNIDFGNNASLSISNGDGTFTTYMNTSPALAGAASVTAADFLGNGTTSIIVTDSSSVISDQTRLLTYSLSSGNLVLSTAKTLPIPRFDLAKYSQYNTSGQPGSHTIRSIAFDFDNSGIPSAVLITAPSWVMSSSLTDKSEIQFLKNDGAGNFTDVTDTVLVGYNTKLQPDYNPQLLDINGDGLTDIFLGGETWDSSVTNTAVLIHTAEHKYVYSYADIFTAFQNQVIDMERLVASASVSGGQTSIIKGPDNTFYMVSMLSVRNPSTGVQEKAIYLSKMGAQTPSAQATAAAIKQAWPYLSDGAVNEVLATTSNTVFSLREINLEKIFNPIGSLRLPGTSQTFSGSITGINMSGINPIAVDDYNRGFNLNVPTTAMQNTWLNNQNGLGQETRASYSFNLTEVNGVKLGLNNDLQSFTVGKGFKLNDHAQLNLQTTNLPFNPFFNMSGSWGTIKSSTTTEASVIAEKDGWIGKAGVMLTQSDIAPGLVTKVGTITSAWAEGGYDFGDTKLFAGLFPKVIGGRVTLNMPTSIDTYGKVSYNNVVAKVTNPTTGYLRLSQSKYITKQSKFTFNAVVTSTGQTKAYGEFKVQF